MAQSSRLISPAYGRLKLKVRCPLLLLLMQLLLLICMQAACTKSEQSQHNFSAIRRSLFKIKVTSVDPNFQMPWLTQPPGNATGSGFYIGDGKILTNAHVVSNATFIKVQQEGSDVDVPAKVLFIADDADLALISGERPGYFRDVPALKLAGIPNLQSPVITVGYPRGGEQLTVTQGVVSRLTYDYYAHSRKLKLPTIQVDSAINPGNSGGPVIQFGKVVGVAFQSQRGDSINYMIPTLVIRHVLEDFKDGTYNGMIPDGIDYATSSTEAAAVRSYYGLDQFSNSTKGVLITHVALWSPFVDHLRRDDIVLAIDGHRIGSDGKVVFYGEKLPMEALIALKHLGEPIRLDIIRDQKRFETRFSIVSPKPHPDMSRYLDPQPYLVYGGLVFATVNADLLRTYGKEPKDYPFDLLYQLGLHDQIAAYRQRPEIVVLFKYLYDEKNRAGRAFTEMVVDKFNGIEIQTLAQLRQMILAAKDEYLQFEFWNTKNKLLVSRADAESIHQRLLEQNDIAADFRAGVAP